MHRPPASEAIKVETLMSMGYSRAAAEEALREAHGDVGEAMVLLLTPQSTPPGGTSGSPQRGRRGSSRGRSHGSPLRQVGTQASATTLGNPYAKSAMTEGAKKGLSYLLPGPVGAMVTQMIDVYLKGSDDSDLESKLEKINRRLRLINDRVTDIEVHIGTRRPSSATRSRGRVKKNKSKRKRKRKTKRK